MSYFWEIQLLSSGEVDVLLGSMVQAGPFWAGRIFICNLLSNTHQIQVHEMLSTCLHFPGVTEQITVNRPGLKVYLTKVNCVFS